MQKGICSREFLAHLFLSQGDVGPYHNYTGSNFLIAGAPYTTTFDWKAFDLVKITWHGFDPLCCQYLTFAQYKTLDLPKVDDAGTTLVI